MTLYLVRHAKAGDRHEWRQPDDERPLSTAGEAQATGLAKMLSGRPVSRVLSSPFRRCVDTVRPLADTLGLDVEPTVALGEAAADDEVLELVAALRGCEAVLCTHGNIVPIVLDHLRRKGTRFGQGPHDWKKGSVWVLETDPEAQFCEARYLPPP